MISVDRVDINSLLITQTKTLPRQSLGSSVSIRPHVSLLLFLSYIFDSLNLATLMLLGFNSEFDGAGSFERFRAYRASNHSRPDGGPSGDETLNSVLHSTFCEFMDGDFEMIRVLISSVTRPSLSSSLPLFFFLPSSFN